MRTAPGDARAVRFAAPLVAVLLAAPVAAAPALLCVSAEGLYCHASDTLAPAWQRLEGQATHAVREAGGQLLVGASSGLFAFSPSGEPRWRLESVGEVFSPSPAGTELYAATLGGQVLRVDARSGAIAWRTQLQGWVYPPAVSVPAVVSGGRAGVLHGLRRSDGTVLWSLPLDQELVHGPLALGPQHVLAWTFSGALYKVEAARGQIVWRRDLGSPAHSAVVADGQFIASLFDRRVVALRGADGTRFWEATLPERARLTVAGARLITDDAEQVSVLERGTGRVLWRRRFEGTVLGVRVLGAERIAVFERDAYRRIGARAVRIATGADAGPAS